MLLLFNLICCDWLVYMLRMDDATRKALGIVAVPAKQTTNRVNVGEAIKLRFTKGLKYSEIAKLQGVCTSSVFEALKPYKNLIESGAQSMPDEAFGELLSAAATVHLAASVDPEKLAKMNGRDHAVSAGIFMDKSRLFKGQATSHTSVFFHVVSESDRANQPLDVDITPQNPPSPDDYLD